MSVQECLKDGEWGWVNWMFPSRRKDIAQKLEQFIASTDKEKNVDNFNSFLWENRMIPVFTDKSNRCVQTRIRQQGAKTTRQVASNAITSAAPQAPKTQLRAAAQDTQPRQQRAAPQAPKTQLRAAAQDTQPRQQRAAPQASETQKQQATRRKQQLAASNKEQQKTRLFEALARFSNKSSMIESFNKSYPDMLNDASMKIIFKSLYDTSEIWEKDEGIRSLFGSLICKYSKYTKHHVELSDYYILRLARICGVGGEIIMQAPTVLCHIGNLWVIQEILAGMKPHMLLDCLKKLLSSSSCGDKIVSVIYLALGLSYDAEYFEFMVSNDLIRKWLVMLLTNHDEQEVDAFLETIPEERRSKMMTMLRQQRQRRMQQLGSVRPVLAKLKEFRDQYGGSPWFMTYRLDDKSIIIHLLHGHIELSVRAGKDDRPYLELDNYFLLTGLQGRRSINLKRQDIFRYLNDIAEALGCYMIVVGTDAHTYTSSSKVQFTSRFKDIFCREDMTTFYQRAIRGMTIVSLKQLTAFTDERFPTKQQLERLNNNYISIRKRLIQNADAITCRTIYEWLQHNVRSIEPQLRTRFEQGENDSFLRFMRGLCQDDDTIGLLTNHFRSTFWSKPSSKDKTLQQFLQDLNTMLISTPSLVMLV